VAAVDFCSRKFHDIFKIDAKTTAEHGTSKTEERQTLLSKIGNYSIQTIPERFYLELTLNFPEPNNSI
jgi:hypothetical protein